MHFDMKQFLSKTAPFILPALGCIILAVALFAALHFIMWMCYYSGIRM